MVLRSTDKKCKFGNLADMLTRVLGAVCLLALLASCGSSDGYSYSIKGTVSGLVGDGLVLQNKSVETLEISDNGSFYFTEAMTDGSTYEITVKTQPDTLPQICTVENGTGQINKKPVKNIVVSCTAPPPRFAIDLSGQFAYVVNYGSNTISAYTIDLATGALNFVNTVAAGTNPYSITIHPSNPGQFAYVVNYGSNTISAYGINPATGALNLVDTIAAGTNPYSLTIIPETAALSGQFAYAADYGSNTISTYGINPATGALNLVDTAEAGNNPHSVTIAPSGEFAYASNTGSQNISVYALDQTTGILTAPTAIDAYTNPASVTIIPATAALSGQFAYVANTGSHSISGYKIETSGALTLQSIISTGTNPSAVTVTPSGKFAYTANYRSNSISVYKINQTSGVLSSGKTASTERKPYAVTIDPSEKFAYAANTGSNTISVYTINQDNGALTKQTVADAGEHPYLVTIDPSGKFAYVLNAESNDIWCYTIDQDNGTLTLVETKPIP